MLNRRLLILPLLATSIAFALCGVGCVFDPPPGPPPPPVPPEIPAPTSPENLVLALEVIYNDKVRTATERRDAYANLLGPSFLFHFQAVDQPSCNCENWGRDEEIAAHENIFQKQDSREIYSLQLDITFTPATNIDPADPNKPDSLWQEVFATNVYLKLLTSPQDGFEVNGAQAEFHCHKGNGRWYIGDWFDLPRP